MASAPPGFGGIEPSLPFMQPQAGALSPFGPLPAVPGFPAPQSPGAQAPAMMPTGMSPASPGNFATARDPSQQMPVETAIDKLRPDSDLNTKTLQKLNAMYRFSQSKMRNSYDRWNYNELKVQAYTPMEDYKTLMDSCRNPGNAPPEPISIVVPYSYATLHAAATYINNVLMGRKPVYPLMATRGTLADRARDMEQALQSNLDASRGQETHWQHIWDSLLYGFSPERIGWEVREGPAIRWIGGQRQTTQETIFAGNVLSAIDPYRFFPDPRVPMHQCNLKGDFMFTEMPISEMTMKRMERAGALKWVDAALAKAGKAVNVEAQQDSARRVRIGGEVVLGVNSGQDIVNFRNLREGTVRLVPKDWGLGDSTEDELWKFTWIGTWQVLQAEPLGMVHGQHPFVVAEPSSLGHDFMSMSMADQIGMFQDVLSWLVTSRMENVRASINNQFIADPARVDVNDIRSSAIGRIIRLKQAAMGLPIQEAIQQLVTQDITQGHLSDIQTLRILADTVTGVNDNLRGIQTAGGRRSATEARIAMQSGAGRLSMTAIRISSQSFQPGAMQMISNIQQFMPDEMWVETTGDDGTMVSSAKTPDMLCGSFNYQISDGSLPFDKTALTDVWKELTMGVAQDPELRQNWDLNKIFEYTAELGGAKNIASFKRQPQPMIAGAAAAPGQDPNMQPLGAAMPQGPITAGALFG